MYPLLKGDERDLADDRVQHVLDLSSEHDLAPLRVGFARKQSAEGQHFTEYGRGFGERERRVGHQVALPVGEQLMDAVTELVRQGHDIAHATLVIEQQVWMRARHCRMGKRS